VIIDFPQSVDASSNQNARKLLLRDVDNLHRFMARFVPEYRARPYAQEMWSLYERGELLPDAKLSGRWQAAERKVNMDSVLGLIGDAARDERRRRENLGLSMRGAAVDVPRAPAEFGASESGPRPLSRYAQKREAQVAARLLEAASRPPTAHQPERGSQAKSTRDDKSPSRARRRRRRKRSASGGAGGPRGPSGPSGR